jgi:HEAT repeat protein
MEARPDVVGAAAARAIERLPGDHPALRELPYVLAEAMHPHVVGMLAPWLRHPNADVVAAAIEALATLGDPSACPLLAPLFEDARRSTVDQGEDERLEATVGELARQAVELLESIAGSEDEPPGEGPGLP